MPIPPFRLTGTIWLGDPNDKPLMLQDVGRHVRSLDLGATLAFPGLVNSHDHLEFNCYPPLGSPPYADFLAWGPDVHRDNKQLIATIEKVPRAVRVQLGILKNLVWGVTSVVHHGAGVSGQPAHPIEIISRLDSIHSPELEHFARIEFLKFWRRRPVVAHLAEGRTEECRQRALKFARLNRLHRRLIGVHGVALKDADFAMLDALVWCPGANVFLFGQTADVAAAKRHTRLLLGTDATVSAPGTLWDHLRKARGVGAVSDQELFSSLVQTARRIWELGGRNDDFVIARGRDSDPWNAFFSTTPQDILVVVRSDRIVLVDDEIAAAHPEISASLTPLNIGEVHKRVAIDVDRLRSDVGKFAPAVDFDAILSRFVGTQT